MKKQNITFVTFLSLVIGSVVGIGIFLKSGRIFTAVENSGGLAVLAWAIGGLISVAAALTIAEIGSQVKGSGGLSAMMRLGTGRLFGFLTGWFQMFYIAGMVVPITLFVMQFFFLGLGIINPAPWMYILGVVVVFGCSLGSNMLSEHFSGMIQQITVYIKLLPIILIIFAGIFLQGNVSGGVTPVVFSNVTDPLSLIALALPAVLFSYDGWIFATTVAEKMDNPKKQIPLGLIFGMSFVTILYVLVNVGVILSGKGNVAAALTEYFKFDASRIVAIVIAISAYGVINGYQLMAKYFAYGLAESNDFFMPDKFRKKTKSGLPLNSTLLVTVIMVVVMVAQMFIPLSGDANSTFTKVEKGYSFYVSHQAEAKVKTAGEMRKSEWFEKTVEKAKSDTALKAELKNFDYYLTGTAYYGDAKPTVDNAKDYLQNDFYDRQANYISDMFTVSMWMFYIVLFISVVVMRFTRPDMKRPYKMPIGIFPIAPLVAILGAAYFIFFNIQTAYKDPSTLVLGLPTFILSIIVILGIGLVLYFGNVRKHTPIEMED